MPAGLGGWSYHGRFVKLFEDDMANCAVDANFDCWILAANDNGTPPLVEVVTIGMAIKHSMFECILLMRCFHIVESIYLKNIWYQRGGWSKNGFHWYVVIKEL